MLLAFIKFAVASKKFGIGMKDMYTRVEQEKKKPKDKQDKTVLESEHIAAEEIVQMMNAVSSTSCALRRVCSSALGLDMAADGAVNVNGIFLADDAARDAAAAVPRIQVLQRLAPLASIATGALLDKSNAEVETVIDHY